MRWLRLALPLIVLLSVSLFLARGLQLDPRHLPSTQINKLAPAFNLPLLAVDRSFSPDELKGKVWIMNIFASWCSACVIEHPSLLQLAANKYIPIVGLAYKDDPNHTRQWIQQHGNPYTYIALDRNGMTGIDYGVYGVPETFVIDTEGIIRYRHVGPIGEDFYEQQIQPLLAISKRP